MGDSNISIAIAVLCFVINHLYMYFGSDESTKEVERNTQLGLVFLPTSFMLLSLP